MIIIIPDAILSSYELFKITDPKNDAVAPKDMNTSENPNVNNIIGKILTLFFSISSFNELPDM